MLDVLKQQLDILLAYLRGEIIQVKSFEDGRDDIAQKTSFVPDFTKNEYRVKPLEKQVLYPVLVQYGDMYTISDELFANLEEAKAGMAGDVIRLITEYPIEVDMNG
jgi:hypothetical protein